MSFAGYTIIKWFYVLIASLMIGVVANLVLFFAIAFIFGGAEGDSWVRWYFGTANGKLFLLVSLLCALPTIPFTKKLKIVSK
jgi:uncharacterized PurR-regulated membrane protein YhhQ (DUF165 family)